MKEGNIDQPKTPEVDPATGLTLEDRALFDEVIGCVDRIQKKDLNGPDGETRYWKIRNIVRDSNEHDVGFELDRWLGRYLQSYSFTPTQDTEKLKTLTDQIRIRGYKSMARRFLEALMPENDKYGGTPEAKLEEAERYAKLAGVPLADIAKEAGLEITEE